MRRLLGLLLLTCSVFGADNTTMTTVSPTVEEPKKGCALYCFITPEKTERVDYSQYNNLSCTHFVYGFADLTSDLQLRGPSSQDESTHSYAGNFYYLRHLKAAHPSASVLLGIHLKKRDSFIAAPAARKKLVSAFLRAANDLHVDGLFLLVDRPFIDNSRFASFFEDLSTLKPGFPVVLAVPFPLLSHTFSHILDSHTFVDAVYLMSTPHLRKISQLDPLLPGAATPPEQTISYHVEALAAKGVPKRKIIVGLSTGSVIYKNYLQESLHEEADGRLAPLQETCGYRGETVIDRAAASQMVKMGHTWIASNAPSEQALGRKVRWLTSSGYGGIGLQSLSHDDPKGECNGGTFPLLHLALSNMECTEKSEYANGCTRLCYINTATPLEKLQPTACSHIVVQATLTLLGEVKLTPEGEATAKWLRKWHVNQKPLLMISVGSQQTSDIWRIATAAAYTRKSFIAQLQSIMAEWKATGVELSWTLGQLDFPTDATNLETLLVEMRQAMGKEKTLMLAVSHISTYNNKYAGMPKLNTTVDHIVLHSHRFHSSRQPFTGHHSPLFFNSEVIQEKKLSVESLVAQWVSQLHMSRSKIIVGITAEPLSMSLQGNDRADSSPFGMVAKPSISNPLLRSTDETKATDGKKVCELEKRKDSRVKFILDLGVPFLVNGQQFVSYENERSVQMKTTWTSLNQLGGIALFETQLDNAEGECRQQPFPLLSMIAKTQMCERCVRVDDVTPCDSAFTTSCSYRLPTAPEQRPMPSSKIPFDVCTQIVVEEVLLKEGGTIHFRDETSEKAMRELALQQPRAGMRRMIASVRCNMTKAAFNDILKNGPLTVSSLISFLSEYSLSGIELRCDQLVESSNKVAFSSFLTGLRTALIESTPAMKCPHSLSLRLPIWNVNLTESYDVSLLNQMKHIVLEPFNDPPQENKTHINSPLFPANGHKYDIDTTISAWIKEGVEKAKILLQIPAYATLQDIVSNVTEIGAAASNPRVINQAQVCEILRGTPSHMMWDRIAVYKVTEKREWMSMQNQETIAYKVFYAIRERLGGMGLLSLNEDDWEAKCGSGFFPLLTAAKARCESTV